MIEIETWLRGEVSRARFDGQLRSKTVHLQREGKSVAEALSKITKAMLKKDENLKGKRWFAPNDNLYGHFGEEVAEPGTQLRDGTMDMRLVGGSMNDSVRRFAE